MEWYYTNQGQQLGPVDDAELSRLAQQGQIKPEDLVWNTSFGDKWMPASSVDNLFTSPPPPVPLPVERPLYSSESTSNSDLMCMARESLSNHWGLGVGLMLLYQVVISGVSGFIPYVGGIAVLIIAGPMAVGLCLAFLSLARRTEANIGQLFQGFNRFGTSLGAYMLILLFVLLWSLLLIIPGIIAGYAYSMTYFIIADDPSVTAGDAIKRSKEMMRGNKWKLFCLYWRFFGWGLLCILTLGIGYLWLGPYMQTSLAHFYDDVKQQG